MLKTASQGEFWSGDAVELNLSFDTLRDYQWERLMRAVWRVPGITGPFERRFLPGESDPPVLPVKTPEPTAAYSEFGALEVHPGVRVGVEVLVTRSLFECVSFLIPLNMFEGVTRERNDAGLQVVEKFFYQMALNLYETTTFSIATIGVNRGFQLMIEMISDTVARDNFIALGNFLIRDDVLGALRLPPRRYQEVMPALRWGPPTDKPYGALI